jgi:hypothetical protein
MTTGGGAPPFNGAPAGTGAAPGGRGGAVSSGATSSGMGGAFGGIGGKSPAEPQGGEPEPSAGDPGDPPGGDTGSGSSGAASQGGSTAAGGGSSGSPTGGSTVSGGAPSGGSPPVPPGLIDDCEDHNNRIEYNEGRNGYWSTFDEAAGCTVSPTKADANTFMSETAPGTGTGRYALHFVSSGGADGCGISLELTNPKKVYDASDYVGISFGARSETADQEILVKVSVGATDPDFGTCDPDGSPDPDQRCYDHFAASVSLTPTWDQFEVLFEDLAQEGWGLDAGQFDATQVVAIQWLARPGDADIWLDDVKFVGD